MLEFACPHCQARVTARPEQAGQKFDCPHCQKRFKVPGSVASATTEHDDFFDWDDHSGGAAAANEPDKQSGGPKPDRAQQPLQRQAAEPSHDPLFDHEFDDSVLDDAGATDDLDPLAMPPATGDDSAADDPFGMDLSQFEREATAIRRQPPAGSPRAADPLADAASDDPLAEESLPSDAAQRGAKPLERNAKYSIGCRVCDARLLVKLSDVGKTIRCPDCYSDVQVPPPSASKPSPPTKSDADTLSLDAERSDSGPRASTYESQLSAKLSADYMARAERELDEDGEERDSTYYDDVPQLGVWFRDVCGFLIEPQVIGRVAILSLAMWVLVAPISAALTATNEGNAAGMFGLLAVSVFAFVVGVPAAALLAVTVSTVLQDTANGREKVDSWPGLDFLDWIPETMYIVSSFAIAGIPAWLVFIVIRYTGVHPNIGLFALVFSQFLLFPFVLLSELEAGSPWVPYSRVVLDSISKFMEPWGAFMFPASILAFATFILLALIMLFGFVVDGVASLLIVIMTFIYFRLLGRLGAQITTIDVGQQRGEIESDAADE